MQVNKALIDHNLYDIMDLLDAISLEPLSEQQRMKISRIVDLLDEIGMALDI